MIDVDGRAYWCVKEWGFLGKKNSMGCTSYPLTIRSYHSGIRDGILIFSYASACTVHAFNNFL